MQTSDFDYYLPQEQIAQIPLAQRDASRLLVLDRQTGAIEHACFREIGKYLEPGDLLVLNQTRVIPARLYGRKIPTGGRVELLLLRREDERTWETLVGGKGMGVGRRVALEGGGLEAEVVAELAGSRRLVRFAAPLEPVIEQIGHTPLPPYIRTRLADPERYQTVYATQPGSAAAPTAGLHFTPELLAQLKSRGVQQAIVTLHVGLDTFAPVTEQNPEEHAIHTEWCQVPAETARLVKVTQRAGKHIIAVGTTSVRALESAAGASGEVKPYEGATSLYILPGHKFQVVDALITNFHLPRSTLIMLVSAFAGRENVLNAYQVAQKEGYRFYSFGDAMLIR